MAHMVGNGDELGEEGRDQGRETGDKVGWTHNGAQRGDLWVHERGTREGKL